MSETRKAMIALNTLIDHTPYLRLPEDEIEAYKDKVYELMIIILRGDR